MKCRICKSKADVELRAHNIALCKDDFIAFFERQVQRNIKKFGLLQNQNEPVAVAVSGGKDSLSLLYLLKKLSYQLSGIYINLGIDNYSDISQEKCRIFSEKFNIPIYTFSLSDFLKKNIYEISKTLKRPVCSVCGNIKRYIMNRFCLEMGFSALATGHNLDDESATLMGNIFNFNSNYLGKEFLSLPSRLKTVKKIKPFGLTSEREVAIYAFFNKIDYIYEECPHSKGATSLKYKEAINLIEEFSPGTKLKFVKNYLKNINIFSKNPDNLIEDRLCRLCGFLTTQEVCSFCNILTRLGVSDRLSDIRDYFVKL